ncbi:hypothetical protein OS493_033538 [Desmophyllum pertusum]|uniref:Uncharacterized protein n=1 Tax=Desmophyllum pertusum TaxID=174260 RepID=A0A9W9Z833_9CNID|nr:hypothetical protein OS493_033538 [Desmophyllum pertusum]
MFETFLEFRKCRDLLSNDTVEVIKQWFDSQMDPKWVTSWSTSSQTFHCQACKQKLETGEYSAEELEEIKHPIIAHVLKSHKVPQVQVRSFTTGGNYIDDIDLENQSSFPDSITRFIETTGRYDVVLDALNIAYFKGDFGAWKVKSVASHFLKQNKKVLVVGSRPMSLHSKDKRVASVMDFLSEHCGVFCLQKIGSQKSFVKGQQYDDVYFLSAGHALWARYHSGVGRLVY